MNLIVVTPSQTETFGPRELSERIIQGITSPEVVNLVGIGAGIPMAIGAVNLSKNIANVNINSVTLDNILIPIYGNQEAIFFELSREPEISNSFIQQFESKEDAEKIPVTVSVSKGDRISAITNLILYKLNKYPQIKVIASGFTILTAVRATLQVVKSGISREPVSINAVLATSVSRRDNPNKKISAIQIYLERGHETVYPPVHAEILAEVMKR